MVWTRSSSESFDRLARQSEKVLVLIKDDEIGKFIFEKKSGVLKNKIFIHFSGLLSLPDAESAHPLITFGENLYDPETYSKITFITEAGRKSFRELFPELSNTSFQIPAEQKALYHAFCVMSGNFTTILWQSFFDYLNKLSIPKESSYLYLQKIAENIATSDNPLTGPLQRKDIKTISRHLEALEDDPMKNIYLSFVEFYDSKLKEKIFEKYT
ncbi:Hypothetical protein IALB_0064 [Ignavibacterium album JCM 16511]|uniref:DUF2520 domain-containing protein n=1 Tax=Ignavibacterium album (strain DSM 19864 / JCM 16511 / NBRC 101810 / Mat9-16) TaxID=945713 RepID=I0AFM1_IGNAJ|nr:DUF2520 domain-containing protein [Ignavibacterium album]AFH47778.1 Hypothetical protein IALB_0064 [Ignavibacterium album JCM 16511]